MRRATKAVSTTELIGQPRTPRPGPAAPAEPVAELLEQAPVGVLVCRGNELLFANSRAALLHGVGADGLAQLLRRFASDAGLGELYREDRPDKSMDYRWPVAGLGRRWIRAVATTGPWDGAPARHLWLLDVTDETERGQALQRSLEAMSEAQRATHIGNWEWNLRTGACSWSDELFRIHGRERASYVPTPYNEGCLHPDDVALVKERFGRCIRDREPASFEYRILRPSGEERTIEVHLNLVLDDLGEPLALTGAANDVTRDKVIQGQLGEEKRKAERASRAKTEFMANMSHELRTPLNAIIGFSEVMRREMFGPMGDRRYREYVESIHDSGEHLLRLINDILDLSKVEAGKYRLREEAIDLGHEIEQCLNTFAVALESKSLALERRIPAALPRLLADRRVFRQILLNLLSNAVKFTRSGSITISAACEAGVAVSVEDTGIGMSAADLERALEPFEQIESSATLSHEGTGIGLPLTKRLLEAHGGDLVLSSAPGAGTMARALFPQYRILA